MGRQVDLAFAWSGYPLQKMALLRNSVPDKKLPILLAAE